MKRHELIQLLIKHGCQFYREGTRHSLFINPKNNQVTTVPRHLEIKNNLVRKIFKDLGIPFSH